MFERVTTDLGIDRSFFAGHLLLGFILITGLAIPFPSLVRALASVPPSHVGLPIALRSRRVRRRVFAGYLDRLTGQLTREAADSNHELYVPLLAVIIDNKGEQAVLDPVAALLQIRTAPADLDWPLESSLGGWRRSREERNNSPAHYILYRGIQ
jgi:hypothetical protein